MFILAFYYDYGELGSHRHIEYFKGKTHYFQKEKYACICSFPWEAKKFKSKKVAENTYFKLCESCVNVPEKYDIIEVQAPLSHPEERNDGK